MGASIPATSLAAALRSLVTETGTGDTAHRVVGAVAAALDLPVALLRQTERGWRFAAEANPPGRVVSAPWQGQIASDRRVVDLPADQRWTALALSPVRRASWILLIPGPAEQWSSTPFISEIAPRLSAMLASESSDAENSEKSARRYHSFGRRLLRARSGRPLYDLILRTMARRVRARTGVLAMYLQDEERLAVVATRGYPIEVVEHVRIPAGHGVLGGVFASGRPVVVDLAGTTSRRLRYRTDSYVALPIKGDRSVLAVAALTDAEDRQPFTRADLNALRMLAAPAGLALMNDRLRQKASAVSLLASTDPLTGLLNRRYFDERLYAELQRARRHAGQLALLMIDLDEFKATNDAYGHVRGDQVLRCVADRLRRSVRIFDVCTRYGGDEFAVLMPSATAETAVAVAERIREAVRRCCSTESFPVTVSIGVAYSGGFEPDVLTLADRALTQAKRGGKDTIRVYS